MAYTIAIATTCSSCDGEGSRIIGYDEQNNPIYENPCGGCGGDGYTTISRMDDTIFEEIKDKINHNKNKIKDLQDTCDEILAKLNES